MAQLHVFSLLGDSNIHRHVNKNTCRANPLIRAAQILPCEGVSILAESLESIRDESNCIIISCMSNFISDAAGPPSVAQRVEPVLQQVLAILEESASWYRLRCIVPRLSGTAKDSLRF